MPNFVTTEAYDIANLGVELASVASLSGAKAGLVTAAVAWGKATTIASLAEATYVGYARQAIGWGAVQRDQQGLISSVAALLRWAATAGPFPITLYGLFVVFGAGPALLGGANFAVPLVLTDVNSAFETVIELIEPSHQLSNFVLTQ